MQSYFITLGTILAVEVTDKTRLIALLLSARYRALVQLILGMTLGYVPAIAVAVLGAGFITQVVPAALMRWLLAGGFLVFGLYVLSQRSDEGEPSGLPGRFSWVERLGPFWVGLLLVAVTEFADKSQIATAGLMARLRQGWPVFWGSLSAQALLNVVYVLLGQAVGRRLPVRLIQRVTGGAFLLFGVLVLLG